jgi:hypothetical protein
LGNIHRRNLNRVNDTLGNLAAIHPDVRAVELSFM